MRTVLHLLSRFDIGGTERQLVERLRRHPRGFRPLLACSALYGKFLEPIRAMGIEPYVVPIRGLAHPSAVVAIARLAKYMLDQRVELVHANDFAMASLGLAAARIAGAKIVVNRVDMGHERPGFGAWHRRLESFTARNADLVCANAEAVRELCVEVEGCDRERVVVLRNGLELRTFEAEMAKPGEPLPIEPGDLPVAVIGNLWPVKCHRVIVEAAALIRERLPAVKFLCAGEGVEKEPVRARIRELKLERNVVLLGHRTDIPSILGRVQAFCLASSAEGLSNAVMEGMAARLPVVATRVGGNPELLAAGRGLLVPPRDPRALADAILRVFDRPAEAREMGRRARAFVEAELTLDRMQAAHEDLYLRALGVPRGTGGTDVRCEQAA